MSFNLIDHRWLPCVKKNGEAVELNMRDVLSHAHEFRELRDESPLVTAALIRLLLAVLHRVFGPRNHTEWHAIWQAEVLDATKLDRYFASQRERFDLFHPTHPFYQVPTMPEDIKPSGIARRAPELANGGNGSGHFNHDAQQSELSVEPAVAARWLVAHQATAFGGTIGGGRGSYFDAPMTRGIVLLIEGDNLFETLILNLVEYDERRPIPRLPDDKPTWETDPQLAQRTRKPRGYLDYLTWQSRTIRLEPSESAETALVRLCTYFDGQRLDPSVPDIDPMMAYQRDDKDTKAPIKPLRLRGERAVWRDAEALFAIDAKATEKAWKRPYSFDVLASLVSRDLLPRSKALCAMACGWDSNQAKVDFWRHERMPLPAAYLDDRELVSLLKKSLASAEGVGHDLGAAVRLAVAKILTPGDKKADADRVRAMVDSLAPERLYWSRLEIPFRRFFTDLAKCPEARDAVVVDWRLQLRRRVWDAFDETAGQLDRSARVLRAVALGRQSLDRALCESLGAIQAAVPMSNVKQGNPV
jgi:CRISPR system Cascade subunit CasA